jgi:glycine oxidase
MGGGTDLLVVGGGIIGLSIAREAALSGLSVALFEKGQPGQEASGASAGMLAAQIEADHPDPLLSLGLESRALWSDFARAVQAESGIDPGLTGEGTLLIAEDRDSAAGLERRFAFQRSAGLEVSRLERDAAVGLEPSLAASRCELALHLPRDVSLDPVLFLRGLGRAAARAGAAIRAGAPAERLVVRSGRVVGIESNGERHEAATTVVASGAWAGGLRGEGIPPLPAHPVRGQIICFDPPRPPIRHCLSSEACYLVPRRDGRLLVGSTMERVGFDTRVTAGAIAALTSAAIDMVPSLGAAPFHSAWAGLRPATADELPAIGPAAIPGLLYACGHLRNGILLAPITARLITRLVRGEDPGLDLAPFDPRRFANPDAAF